MSNRSEDALIALRRIQRKTELAARKLAETEALTSSQLKVMQLVHEHGEASMGWLSEQTHLKQATLTSLVDKLVARNMVTRRRCDEDRRRVWLKLEGAGVAAIKSAPDLLQTVFQTRFDKLPDWQQAMIVSSLEQVSCLLDATDIDASPFLDIGDLG